MNKLKYIKLFESVEDLGEDLTLSLTEEDIEDYLTAITDRGFKISIKKKYYDTLTNYELYVHHLSDRKYINTKIINNQVKGGYLIDIFKESYNQIDNTKLHYSTYDLDDYKFLLSEFSQLSKRVDYLEWEPGDSHGNFSWRVLIFCPLSMDKKATNLILKNNYSDLYKNILNYKYSNMVQRVKDQFTPKFSINIIGQSKNINNKVYFQMKSIPNDAVLNLNIKKIIGLKKNYIKNIDIIRDIDIFKLKNKNIGFLDKNTNFLLEIEYDRNQIIKDSKKIARLDFINRQNDE